MREGKILKLGKEVLAWGVGRTVAEVAPSPRMVDYMRGSVV